MFGLFKAKEVNKELLVDNVASAVIDVWVDKNNLDFQKFADSSFFGQLVAADEKAVNRFFREKLRIACSTAINASLRVVGDDWSEQMLDGLVDEILATIKKKLRDENLLMLEGIDAGLSYKAREYAQQRFSVGAKEAGQWLESTFANEIFGRTPSESDIDARYLLYKQLSGFERTVLFSVSSAVRQSRQ